MERILYAFSGALLLGLVGLIFWRLANDPLGAERQYLEDQLAQIPPTMGMLEDAGDVAGGWDAKILQKGKMWEGLVPPPPPPPPKPKAPPAPPDLNKMLTGVRASWKGIGDSAFMIWPGNIKGTFVSVGETIQGCTVKSIDSEYVTFSHFWKEGNQELLIKIPRERGRLN